MKNKRQIGAAYEQKAAAYLREQGYVIERMNLFTPFGEIDIVARKERTLVFVEIKYRSKNTFGDPLDAVDHRKQKRICKAAMYFYRFHGYEEQVPCRFDVIAIYKDQTIRHIQDAFAFEV